MNWIKKWLTSFMMGTTSSTTLQSLGEIVQRAPAVGVKMWCLYGFFVTLRGRRAVCLRVTYFEQVLSRFMGRF